VEGTDGILESEDSLTPGTTVSYRKHNLRSRPCSPSR